MKKLSGIFFLLIILLNTIGYYGILVWLQQQQTTRIREKIKTNASEISGNLILTIPLSLPYTLDQEEYTPLKGEIVYEGKVYRLVKQKLYKNILYVVCIRDQKGSQVNKAIGECTLAFSSQQAEHTNRVVKVNPIGEYYITIVHSNITTHYRWCRVLDYAPDRNLYSFNKGISIFHPPPYSYS